MSNSDKADLQSAAKLILQLPLPRGLQIPVICGSTLEMSNSVDYLKLFEPEDVLLFAHQLFSKMLMMPSASSKLPKNRPEPMVTLFTERFCNAKGKAATDAKLRNTPVINAQIKAG